MVQINFALKEVNCKIVYYGPGMSGKTTNLEIVHQKAPTENKGELTSIATEGDRTLFFDFMPLDLGNIAGMRTKFQLYTVPGQVYYNSTRKLVLQGVDGIIFVADSQAHKMEENRESFENLKNNLSEYGKSIDEIPMVVQYNKRDLPNTMEIEKLQEQLNARGVPYFEAVATTGEGVFPTLKALSGMVLESLSKDRRSTSPHRKAVTATKVPNREAVAAVASTPSAPGHRGAADPSNDSVRAQTNDVSAPPKFQPSRGGQEFLRPAPAQPATPAAAPKSAPTPTPSAPRPAPASTSGSSPRSQSPEAATPSTPAGSRLGGREEPAKSPESSPLVQKFVLEEERGSPYLWILLGVIVAAVIVILYSFKVL